MIVRLFLKLPPKKGRTVTGPGFLFHRARPEAMVEAMESIKTAAIHADARAELANLLEKAAEELAVGAIKVAPTGLVI